MTKLAPHIWNNNHTCRISKLQSGEFPDSWKMAMVTPIQKIPKTKNCKEFRPINTLKTMEKILEKVMKEQLEAYIEKHKILTETFPVKL